MSSTPTLLDRNRVFAKTFSAQDLPIIPKLRTVILTCGDARVDPAHILGLGLGDAVVIRNNGGRVTQAAREEIATLAFMVQQIDGGPFELVLLHHTQCGAERFADPNLQAALRSTLGIDVSEAAIADHDEALQTDLERLRADPNLADDIVISALLYDVATGAVREVIPAAPLRAQPAPPTPRHTG